jgi:hypothetical protein
VYKILQLPDINIDIIAPIKMYKYALISKYLRNEANFDILYTIYCNLGQFTLIIRKADYKKA